MTQHFNHTQHQGNPSAPTFQRHTPQGSTAYNVDAASDLRQQMQAQRPAGSPDQASHSAGNGSVSNPAAQPQPLSAGGQGPLAGLGANARTDNSLSRSHGNHGGWFWPGPDPCSVPHECRARNPAHSRRSTPCTPCVSCGSVQGIG